MVFAKKMNHENFPFITQFTLKAEFIPFFLSCLCCFCITNEINFELFFRRKIIFHKIDLVLRKIRSCSLLVLWIWYLGHRHAVGRQGQVILDLKSSAFDPKEKVWTRFPPEGSKYTPPHNSSDFKWKDYCPKVFRLVITPITKDSSRQFMTILP
jgi:hypothetical protein